MREGPVLLEMRVKQLTKGNQQAKATLLAKACSQSPAMQGQGPFRQMYLVCLCATSEQEELMAEVSGAAHFFKFSNKRTWSLLDGSALSAESEHG